MNRSDIYLQSKFTPLNGQDPEKIPYDSRGSLSDQVAESFHVSLNNLRTDYLDCLVLHSPLGDSKQTSIVWLAMTQLVKAGQVNQLGISNCYKLEALEKICQASTVKPAVIQNRFYADSQYDRNIRIFCQQQGINYQSFWTLTANPQILASSFAVRS